MRAWVEVKMAEVSLIYSAFPTGARTDRIRAFMQQVYDHWSTRPEFVLLVGGYSSCIPSRTRSSHLLTASHSRLSSF
ncbi:hypothetical protein JXD38_07375 [candidate division WOR-3 bacterium]|nr:hypothetical protein [candidate division WOR-3 bacterium]